MIRILLLPITLPLRVAAFQLRIARGAAEVALDVARDLAGAAPRPGVDGDEPAVAAPPALVMPAAPRTSGADPVEPAREARRRDAVQRSRARRTADATDATVSDATPAARPADGPAPKPPRTAAAGRSTRSAAAPAAGAATGTPGGRRTTRRRAAKPPDAAAPTPPAVGDDDAPRPRPRRAARKAGAERPARRRKSGPTKAEAAAIREAQREAEGEAAAATAGPASEAGPEIRVEAPWEGYDAMPLDQVLARLENADPALVAAVRLYESRNENRQAVLLATETPE